MPLQTHSNQNAWDVIVIGGGHAGCDAAAAAGLTLTGVRRRSRSEKLEEAEEEGATPANNARSAPAEASSLWAGDAASGCGGDAGGEGIRSRC